LKSGKRVDFIFNIIFLQNKKEIRQGRKGGRREGRKEGRMEGRKEG
jgi:predicted transposase YdaD